MDNTTYVSLSRQNALWNQLEVVANNMANVNTIGFKGSDVLFSEYLVKVRSDDRPFKDKVAFTQDFGLIRDMNQGPLRHTNNTLDLALQDDGYFVLQGKDGGENYTRAGNFTLDIEGRIVNQEGLPILSTTNQPIMIDASIDDIVINGDGGIIVNAEEVDRIRVVDFGDPRELQQVDGTLFSAQGMQPIEIEFPRIAQGALEDSNVNGVTEMTRLIALNRAYQDIGKMIESEHARQKKANDVFTRQV